MAMRLVHIDYLPESEDANASRRWIAQGYTGTNLPHNPLGQYQTLAEALEHHPASHLTDRAKAQRAKEMTADPSEHN